MPVAPVVSFLLVSTLNTIIAMTLDFESYCGEIELAKQQKKPIAKSA